MPITMQDLRNEELVIAELEQLDVTYLSRLFETKPGQLLAPHQLLAKLIQQPSSRVRAALISLLLAHPEYARHAIPALRLLQDNHAQQFKFFYTAAVYLQVQFESSLRAFMNTRYQTIPDLFSKELKIEGNTPLEKLRSLAYLHSKWNGLHLNWAGTYQNAALHLLRRWKLEKQWNL